MLRLQPPAPLIIRAATHAQSDTMTLTAARPECVAYTALIAPWLAFDKDADQFANSMSLHSNSSSEGCLDSGNTLPLALPESWQRQPSPLQPLTQPERP